MSEVMCFQGKAGILTRPTDSSILISASYVSNPWERADRRLKGREDSVTTPVFPAWKMVTLVRPVESLFLGSQS